MTVYFIMVPYLKDQMTLNSKGPNHIRYMNPKPF